MTQSPRASDPDPQRITGQQEYRTALTDLRVARGIKSLKEFERVSEARGKRLPQATVSQNLNKHPLPDRAFVCDYLRACGLTDAEQESWMQAWDTLHGGRRRWWQSPGRWIKSAAGRLDRNAVRQLVRRRWPVMGVALVVVAAGLTTGTYSWNHCWTFNPDLSAQHGECTGVTDGSDGADVFGAGLAPVLKALKAENDDAGHEGAVTLALLTPLGSVDSDKDLTLHQYIREAEGAYTALEQANQQGNRPKIRLLLANMGSGEQQWRQVVDRLKTTDGLVGVIGLGLSQQESVQAARHLSTAGIPMVADLITADGFDTTGTIDHEGPIKGLVRITQPNALQLAALATHIPPGTHTAALVRSSVTPNGTTDLGTKTLDHDFRTVDGVRKYLSKSSPDFEFNPLGGAKAIMPTITQNLCNTGQRIDLVYYAARAKYLPDFLDALRHRSCHEQKITVLAGSDAAAVDPGLPAFHDKGAPVTLLYANYPTPAWLSSSNNRDRDLYLGFVNAFTAAHHGQQFPASDLTGSYWALLGHDAVLTAATAIHNAAANTNGTPPSRYDVSNQLYALTNDAVPGASGRFGIDQTGNRTNQNITVHQD
ncbi:hypothetical protein [Streptomyces aureus]|uniref:hypothetical protein n=1 Tax=Streptomyces aureus TaxID=193461 RepID=UPI0036889A50